MEDEQSLKDPSLLVHANKKFYQQTCDAVLHAARILGVREPMSFYAYSKNNNQKIDQTQLHQAFKAGGASHVATDEYQPKTRSGSNDGQRWIMQRSSFHWATLRP